MGRVALRHRALAGTLHGDGHRIHDDLARPKRSASRCPAPHRFPRPTRGHRADGGAHRPAHRGDGVGRPAAFEDPRRRRIRQRDQAVHALGGSTNALIHLIAMARRAGIELELDRFDELAQQRAAARQPATRGQIPDGGFLLRGRVARAAEEIAPTARHELPHGERQDAGREHRGAQRSTTTDVIRPRDKALDAERQPRPSCAATCARRRGYQAARRRVRACISHGAQRWCSRTITTFPRASTIRRSRRRRRTGAGAAKRRAARRARHAGMGPTADPEEAPAERRAGHGAHFGCAHERHVLRRLRAARRARISRRRPARARARRRPDRARCRRRASSTSR